MVTSHLLESGSSFHNPFLVEEENRSIGWTFINAKKSHKHKTREDQQQAVSQTAVTREMQASSHVKEKKMKIHHMEKKLSQASQGQSNEEASGQKELSPFTNNQRFGNQTHNAATVVLALSSTSSELGKKSSLKHRHYRRTKNMERIEQEKAAEAEMGMDTETTEMHEKGESNEENGDRRTRNFTSMTNRVPVLAQPEPPLESLQRGKKWKATDQLANESVAHRQKGNRGRPRKVRDQPVNDKNEQ